MRVEFHQVPIILLSNSSYLGNLTIITDKEVNVNLRDLRNIDLFLPKDYIKYNYIKVIDNDNSYFYILDNYRYESGDNVRLFYKIDIIRTLRNFNNLDYNIRLNKYSGEMNLSDKQKNYFWNNQSIKLGGNILNDNVNVFPKRLETVISGPPLLQGMQWVYIWLKPRQEQLENQVRSQYKMRKVNMGDTAVVDKPYTSIPNPNAEYFTTFSSNYYSIEFGHDWFDNYPVGTVFKTVDPNSGNNIFYVSKQKRNSWFEQLLGVIMTTRWVEVTTEPINNEIYSITDMPVIDSGSISLPLHLLAFPVDNVRFYYNTDKWYDWGIDNVLPYLNDPTAENDWADNIVDVKISSIPPFDVTLAATFVRDNEPCIMHSGYGNFPGMLHNVKRFDGTVVDTDKELENDIYIPSLAFKPSGLLEMESDFKIQNVIVNRNNTIYNKFYISVLEDRIELDIALLKHDNATKLVYYEDISPGRSNIMLGFTVKGDNELRYLVHSPSTLSLDRDLSLPLFTSAYGEYLANNKNFMAQAELSRKTQLTTGLINSGAQGVGAAAVSLTMPGYSPINAVARAAGGAANSIITYKAQQQQFKWSLDNIKSSPGSYKAANATLITRYNLGLMFPWISKYTSTDFDIELYEQLVEEIGYEYFDYKFKLRDILTNLESNYNKPTAILQGRLVGLGVTEMDAEITILLSVLNEKIQEGIQVYK